MYSALEVKEALENEPLSKALLRLQLYATSLNLVDLAEWSRSELSGYDSAEVPKYRYLNFQWLDENLRFVRLWIEDPDRDLFWHHTHVTFGVDVMELWKGNVDQDNPKMRGYLENQNINIRLGGIRFIEEVYLPLLTRIRVEAQRKLAETIPRGALLALRYPLPDLSLITTEPELQGVLRARWHEANSTYNAGAPLATIILLGSILEGCLLAGVQRHPRDANTAPSAPKNPDGSVKVFGQWTLSNLIAVAHELNWIRRTTHDVSIVAREYRNLVHPREQVRRSVTISDGDARVNWEVVSSVIADLSASL